VNERRLLEASSNLEMKAATLRAAQASLSDTEGQLHDELERNTDLSRDNCMMQRQMELLAEDNKQLSKVGARAAAAAKEEENKREYQPSVVRGSHPSSRTLLRGLSAMTLQGAPCVCAGHVYRQDCLKHHIAGTQGDALTKDLFIQQIIY